MKRKFTILTAALALLAFLAIPMGMWGQTRAEVVSYTLEPATGSNNSYTGNCDITIDGITWNLTGNSQQIPWRIGGKSISNVDRPLYSKTAISDNISKIEVTHGAASSITVNSWTVIVASDASFTNVVSTLTPTFAANATTTINRPTGADWSNCYYKFVYNVSVSGSTNRFVQFTQAKFYKEEGTGPVIATPNFSPIGGDYTTAQNVTISCETQGATIYYTTDGSTPDNTSTQYTTAISVSSTTTINAIAYVGTDASSIATATYNIVQPLATMQAIFDKATEVGTTATYVYITLDNWVVSGVSTNGKNVFVTDGTKGFVIFDNGANMGFTAGDVLSGTVYCKVQLYNGFAELTQLNSTTSGLSIATGGTVTVANVDMADLVGVNTGALLHYDNLTCSVNNNKYYLSDGTTTLQVYNALYAFDALEDGETYNITGIYQQYNSTKEILPRSADDIEEVVTAEPSVTVTPNIINAPAEGAEGNLALAYENITEFYSFDFYFCDAEGEELQEDPDWIYAEINPRADDTYILDYLIDANNGEARTAYMKVYTFDDDEEEVYAIVTVNQAEYVVDYAVLPFEWEGGERSVFENLAGVTNSGVGDYPNQETYKMKLDDTGDYIQVKTDSRPGLITIGVKMVGGNSTSTITVQGSADGETFTDIQALSISGAQNSIHTLETTNSFGENDRYVRLLFTKGSNVGVGPITIAQYTEPVLVASITVNPATVNVDATPAEGEDFIEGTLDLTWENLEITDIWEDFAIQYYDAEGEELTDDPDWIVVEFATQDPSIGEGYLVSYMVDVNEGEARTAYFKVFALGEEDYVYSNLVTITQAAPVVPPTPGNWVLTNIADLTVDDIFVIVGDNGNTYAMSNDNGFDEAPAAVPVTVVDNTLSGDIAENIQWNISGSASSGYMFYPNGSDIEFLFCNNANNGLRVGGGEDDEDALFNITDDYLYNIGQERYIGIYNNQDWRCYTSINNNIKNQTFAFYKKVETHTLDITGYGDSTNGGYCLIASPVTVNPENVEGMTVGNFDLYRFNQSAESEWENWKKQGDHYHFNLVPGKGYLYAHKTGGQFTLTGTPYSGNGQITLTKTDDANADFQGWNLVGNPFTENAYIDGGREFYTMQNDGSEILAATNNSIEAMEGVFVIADHAGETITFTTTAPTNNGKSIALNLSNDSKVIDRAIVRFGEGGQLPKFQLNKNHTKVYIPQDGKDYAVVRSEEMGEMPVSFKAENNGTFSLSVNGQNTEFAYLHLIDNLTGNDIDMLQTPSYSFEAKTTDYESRFKLVFATGDNSNEDNFAYFSNGSFVINNEGNATLQVIDIAGRIVKCENINGCANVNVNAAPGVYMLRLVNGDNMKIQKVVVK